MGYAILRHGKIKAAGKGVCVAHNRRLAGEKKENIDASLTQLNQYQGDARVVDRINSKLPGKRRKDAVEAVELVLSASPEFFDGLATDRRELAKHPIFQKWKAATVAWAKGELGDNVVDISLHMDEKTPHFHVLFTPLIEGRLCAKQVTSRMEMQRRQTEYAAAMAGFGLKRGQAAAETHREHIPLKGKPSGGGKAAAELVEAKAQISRLEGELAALQRRYDHTHNTNMKFLGDLTRLEAALKALKAQERVEATPPIPTPHQQDENALAGFLEAHKELPKASPGQIAVGVVKEACGRFAVLSIGRGVLALAEFQDERELELHRGQQGRGGIGR